MSMSDFDKVSFAWPTEGNPWDGLPMARLGLRASFYLGNAYGPEARRPLLNIIEQYIALAGGRIQAYQRTGDRRRKQATAAKPVDLTPLRDNVSRTGTPFAIEMSAESEASAASLWSLLAAADDAGFLVMHFPVSAFEGSAPHSFRNLFQKWCSELNVRHAYAGLGLALPLTGQALGEALKNCGPYVKRFVGLDVDSPGATADFCRDGFEPSIG